MSTPVIEIAGPRNGITVEKIEQEIKKSPLKTQTSGLQYSDKSKIVIEGYDFRIDSTGNKQCSISNCQDITIRRCIFGNKTTLGQGLNITGANTKRVLVEYCIFENMTFTDDNGGEPLRFGLSPFSGISYESIVRNCIFRGLNSDPEAISNKSCRNVFEDNFFINNKSNVTVRHGGLATIQHNYFKGRGGIRLHGYGNVARYNCFEGHGVDKFYDKNGVEEPFNETFSPIVVRYGNAEKDPNFVTLNTPSEKEGPSHAMYARTVDNVIEGNEFKNCAKTIISLAKGQPLEPVNITNVNNDVVTKFSFEEDVVVPPPEPPVDPPVEEEPRDKFHIKKLYADSDGTVLFRAMDMDNPSKDAFLNKEETANMKKQSDGSWSLDGKYTGQYQVRLGIWMNPPQTDVEATIYAYHIGDVSGMADESKYSYQLYRGGGDHTTSNNGSEGNAYKARIQENKYVVICKELRHADYTSNKGNIKKLTKSPIGNWIGVKFVTFNLPKLPTGRTPVMTQVFCDESGMDANGVLTPENQKWVKMAEYVDKGGWAAGSTTTVGRCPPLEIGNKTGKRKTDEIFNMPGGKPDKGNIVTYRTDGARTKIKYFSVRSIKPTLLDILSQLLTNDSGTE